MSVADSNPDTVKDGQEILKRLRKIQDRELEPCGVCKFHWNLIVMPGDTHNRNCPYYDDEEKGCACQGCGERYKVDVEVPDDLWNQIRPEGKPEGTGLLCGCCIFSRVEALGKHDDLSLARRAALAGSLFPQGDWQHVQIKAGNPRVVAIQFETAEQATEFINAFATATSSPTPAEPRACVKCGHYNNTDPQGCCAAVQIDAAGNVVPCRCQCEFTPDERTEVEGEQGK